MLRKRREIILVVSLAALVIVAGRFFAANTITHTPRSVAPAGTTNQHAEPIDRSGTSNLLKLSSSTPSAPIRIGSNQCLQWWGERHDTYRVEVAGFGGQDWQPNETFLAAKTAGTAEYNSPAWYRFAATTKDETKISYRIMRGLCR